MKVQVHNLNYEPVSTVILPEEIFALEVRQDILQRVINWQLAKRQAGTHHTKEIGDVQGSTRKIYRQKGTGGARHGSRRAAQFVGGSIIFGPHTRSHTFKLNKKVRRLGLKMALSSKMASADVIVLDEAAAANISTRVLANSLHKMSVSSAIIVDSMIQDALRRSAANLRSIDTLAVAGLNVHDIIRHDKIIVTKAALVDIQERLK